MKYYSVSVVRRTELCEGEISVIRIGKFWEIEGGGVLNLVESVSST